MMKQLMMIFQGWFFWKYFFAIFTKKWILNIKKTILQKNPLVQYLHQYISFFQNDGETNVWFFTECLFVSYKLSIKSKVLIPETNNYISFREVKKSTGRTTWQLVINRRLRKLFPINYWIRKIWEITFNEFISITAKWNRAMFAIVSTYSLSSHFIAIFAFIYDKFNIDKTILQIL